MTDSKKRGTASPQSDSPKNNDSLANHESGKSVNLSLAIPSDKFEEMYNLEVGHMVEKRGHGGGFNASYLSWSYASLLLYTNFEGIHPALELNEAGSILHNFGNEYESDYHLRIYLTDGERRTPSIFFPIMDKSFRSLSNPTSREVSDAVQRGKVKAIAEFTGIGLKLYTGDDIPTQSELDTDKIVQEADRVEPLKEEAPSPKAKEEAERILNEVKKKPEERPYTKPPSDAVFLNVPFKEKDEAKQLGARWDKEAKKWYFLASEANWDPFRKFLSKEQIAELTEEVGEGNSEEEKTETEEEDDVPF